VRVPLPPLSELETLELTRSLFGETPHLRRVATLLHERSSGNPAHTMELAEHMLRTGLARYAGGAWVLPQDVADEALPLERLKVHAAKLSRLSQAARRLAQVLSLYEGPLSLPRFRRLSELAPTELFGALELLVYEGVLIGSEDGYRFLQSDVRRLLADELDAERRSRAHRALGEDMLAGGVRSSAEKLRVAKRLVSIRNGDS